MRVSTLVTSWDFLCCVQDGQHIYLVRLNVVDDPVGTFENFTNLRVLEFRDNAPGQGEFANLLGSSRQTVNNAQSVLR